MELIFRVVRSVGQVSAGRSMSDLGNYVAVVGKAALSGGLSAACKVLQHATLNGLMDLFLVS